MSSPSLSIIIVNWNGRRWLERCLRSLESQTWRDFEVVLVDNASSDDSVEFVRREFPRTVVVVNSVNLGFAGGNNLGVSRARGELLLLLNSDTWLEPDLLARLTERYRQAKADVLGVGHMPYNGGRIFNSVRTLDPLGYPVDLEANEANRGRRFYLNGTCLLFSRELYRETGGLDPNFFMYFEETDWFWRLHLLKKTFACAEDLAVHHAIAGSTGRGLKYRIFLWRNQNNPQMLLKNYSAASLFWVMPSYLAINLVEMACFLTILRPDLTWSYVQGWWFNLIHLRRTLRQRQWVQSRRLVPDREIFKKMYPGSAKLRHLRSFISASLRGRRPGAVPV